MIMLTEQGLDAASQIDALPREQKKAAVAQVLAANPDLFPTGDGDRTRLWLTLLVGLQVLGLAALAATVVLSLEGEDVSAVVALVTAIVGGLIGLFARSPGS